MDGLPRLPWAIFPHGRRGRNPERMSLAALGCTPGVRDEMTQKLADREAAVKSGNKKRADLDEVELTLFEKHRSVPAC
jgi:hypothetical protein